MPKSVKDRLAEPSTWAGIAAMLGPWAAILPGTAGLVVGGVAASCGSVAVWLREGR
ncbi:MAG: hypothetical protein H6R10_587 [Rhodocyclaceae bacterium]|nr:hypothetical protein [Rhodocyclaceae bacterium]